MLLGTAFDTIHAVVKTSVFPVIRLLLPLLKPWHCQELTEAPFQMRTCLGEAASV